MRASERDLLYAWIVNEESRIANELHEIRNRIRYRDIDVNDNVEMMLTQQRYADFRDFTLVLIRLLNLDLHLDNDE